MVTKRTRLISGLVAILMLVSMFAAFVLPVSAETTSNYDEVAGKALVDKSKLPDIKDGYSTSVKEYQVTDREGLDVLVEASRSNEFQNVSFYQMADIDMGWIPFEGISGYCTTNSDGGDVLKNFRGNWDGNGFVIKNLYMNRINANNAHGTGFFNAIYTNYGGTSIKNFGIANGLIIGYNRVGSIAGYITTNTVNSYVTFTNCWSAATVVGAGSDGVGGLIGTMAGSCSKECGFYNCYFLGNVINSNAEHVGGFQGWQSTTSKYFLKNSYNAGAIIAGASSTSNYNTYVDSEDGTTVYAALGQAIGYQAFVRLDATNSTYVAGNFSNNYYLDTIGQKSLKDAVNDLGGYVKITTDETTGTETYSKGGNIVVSDDGTAVTATELASLSSRLNEGITNNTGDGYTVKYSNSTAGFPVLTYYNSENEIVAKRLPTYPDQIGGKGYLKSNSTLFKNFVEKLCYGGTAKNGKLDNIEVATANDLMALVIMTNGLDGTQYTSGKILFTADIDASKQTLIPGLPYYSCLSGRSDLKTSIDGQNHIIYNFHNYSVAMNREPAASLVHRLGTGAGIVNLGMVNAKGTFDFGYGNGYAHPALMVAQAADNAANTYITNCFATGDLYMATTKGNIVNTNDFGGLIGCIRRGNSATCAITNSWADTTVHLQSGATQKARAVGVVATTSGSTAAAVVTWKNVAYIASELPQNNGGIDNGNTAIDLSCQPYLDLTSNNDGQLAWYMNNKNAELSIDGLWTVADSTVTGGKITTFGDATNATRRVASNFLLIDGSVDYSTYEYLNTGKECTIKSYDLYELKAEPTGTANGKFTVTADVALDYELTGANYAPAQEIVDDFGRYDYKLFSNGEAMKAAVEKANAALAYKEKEETVDNIVAANKLVVEAVELYEAAGEPTLKTLYYTSDSEYLGPLGRDYELYKEFNPSVWIVAEDDDWRGLVNAGAVSFAGSTIHFVKDIDMENKNVNPLGLNADFKGTLDGHGHVINNLLIDVKLADMGQYVGLIWRANTGDTKVIKNLGIASGEIKANGTGTSKECMVSAFVSIVQNTKIINCWNGASVTAFNGNCSLSGIARASTNNVIDGCYNIGTLTNLNGRTSGINDWCYNTTYLANSFNFATMESSGNVEVAVTQNNTTNTFKHVNSYGVGSDFAFNDTANNPYNTNGFVLSSDAYSTGELAYTLNKNYTNATGVRTWYTWENGKTGFGTEKNYTAARVVLNFENREDEYLYLNADDTTLELTITYAEGNNTPEFKLAGDYKSTIDGSTLTYNAEDGDVEINVTFDGDKIDYVNYLKAMEVWGQRDAQYFKTNADGKTLAEVLTEAKALYMSEDATQEAVDAMAEKFNDFEYVGYPTLPVASEYEKYTDAPGYLIKTSDDLVAAGENSAKFTAEQILYLEADLDLTDETFTGFDELRASFDGGNHTISNWTLENTFAPITNAVVRDTGFFMDFYGAYIKNLTMKNAKVSTDNRDIAVLVSTNKSTDLTIENVDLIDCTVTLTNKLSEANSISGLLGVSDVSGTVNITNCTVTGSTIESAEGTKSAGNLGFVIGVARSGATFNVTDVLVENCTLATVGAGAAGFAIGAVEGSGHVVLNNVGVLNNKRINSTVGWDNRGLVIGLLKDKAEMDLSNIVILNNDQAKDNQADIKDNMGDDWNVAFNLKTDANCAASTYTNIYSDESYISNDDSHGTSSNLYKSVTAEDYGMIAYAMNSVGTAQKWEITAEGNLAVDTDGQGLPKKVTFKTNTVDYTAAGDPLDVTLYTNENGNLIGFDAVEDEIRAAGPWTEAEIAEWSGTYSADRDYTVNPYPAHDESHEMTAVPNADGETHTLVCTHEEGEVLCQYKEENVACNFVDTCVDKNAEPDEAKHYGLCACGNKKAEVLCKDDGMEKKTVESTLYVNGTDTYTCSCGYEHVDTLPLKVGLDTDADKAYVGEEVTITVSLKNARGLDGAVADITYDHSKMLLKGAKLLAPNCNPQVSLNVSEETGEATDCIAFVIGYDYTGTELMELTFAVPAGTEEGKTNLKIDMRDISTHDLEDYDVESYEGQVEILDLIRGDMDGDRTVTIADAIVMLRYVNENAEDLYAKFPDMEPLAGDVDRNGKVELKDVIYVLQFLNHLISDLKNVK